MDRDTKGMKEGAVCTPGEGAGALASSIRLRSQEFAGCVGGMASTSVAGGPSAGKEGFRFCVSNRSSGRMNELLSIDVNYGEKN